MCMCNYLYVDYIRTYIMYAHMYVCVVESTSAYNACAVAEMQSVIVVHR